MTYCGAQNWRQIAENKATTQVKDCLKYTRQSDQNSGLEPELCIARLIISIIAITFIISGGS